jgi:sialic acid synthase SpsE
MKLILDCCNNHLGNKYIIKEMIKQAKNLQADYVKFQQFFAHELSAEWQLRYKNDYEYYYDMQLSLDKINTIFKHCDEHRITPMFTVFSKSALAFISTYNRGMDYALKIASPDMMNDELIELALKKEKELFISTGMHIDEQIQTQREKYPEAIFMCCSSKYPSELNDIDKYWLKEFNSLSSHIPFDTKLFDHLYSLYTNCDYVELHFTLSHKLPTRDDAVSYSVDEVKRLFQNYFLRQKDKMYKMRWKNER